MESILVTGAAGYIGSILTQLLVEKGYNVIAIDNFMYRQNSLLNLCKYPNFQIIRGDSRNKLLIKPLIKTVDVIVPLAAIVGMPACRTNPDTAKAVNTDAIEMLCDFKSKEQCIIFPNTNSGYGLGLGTVFCTEDTELKPISVYGKTKVEAEKFVSNEENHTIFRLATVFGVSPKMRLDLLVNDFTYRAWYDGFITVYEADFVRNYVSVHDVAHVFLNAIAYPEVFKNQIFNFGLTNANLTKLELCNKIKEHIPSFNITVSDLKADVDQRNYKVSNEKIDSLGFGAKTSIDSGIEELLKSFNILNTNQYTNIV